MVRRFGLYFIGVFLGLAMVAAIFGKRVDVLTSWFPQSRMRTEIIEKTKSETLNECFTKSQLGSDYEGFIEFVNEAHVEFSTMERQGESRIYKVLQTEGSTNYLKLELNDSNCTLLAAVNNGKEFLCN